MSTPFRFIPHCLRAAVFLAVLLPFQAYTEGAQSALPADSPAGVIALDPGHGGNDMGARGPDQMTEKKVVMAFAEAMTERLKKTYRVVLTRNDDYALGVFDRTAVANHNRADLFVSIHTGASFRSYPRGISLFYHEPDEQADRVYDSRPAGQWGSSENSQSWDRNRPSVVERSRHLCESIRGRLARLNPDLKPTVAGAPLIVMAGADMPAVLIEIGTLTNPMDAKALQDKIYLSHLVQGICGAIDDFFSKDRGL